MDEGWRGLMDRRARSVSKVKLASLITRKIIW